MLRMPLTVLIAAGFSVSLSLSAATLTVNTTNTTNEADGVLTLTEAILAVNGELGRPLDPSESDQVTGTLGTDDAIHFNIAGDGPHTIAEPFNGFTVSASDVTIDGYTQPGASPNTNDILGGNNAVLQIVIDATNGNHTFQDGGNEGDIMTLFGDNIVIRGISFLSTYETAAGGLNYGINFRDGAAGGQVGGCWIGLSPDAGTVAGGEIGLGACSTAGGHAFGTNGDGVDDRAEFNVIAGFNVNTIVEGAANVKIAGNYIGILPDGVTVADDGGAVGEGDAIEGGGFASLVIGTDGDGVADADERNVIGGMKDEVFQVFSSPNPNVRFSGNYVGVGVDGTTSIANNEFFRGDPMPGFLIGSDFDGTSDELEGNIIANHTGTLLNFPSDSAVTFRGNSLFNNTGALYESVDRTIHAQILARVDNIAPVISDTSGCTIQGQIPLVVEAVDFTFATVDLYVADPGTVGTNPQGLQWVASFEEGGPDDGAPNEGAFLFDVSAVADQLAGQSIVVTATVPGEPVLLDGAETSVFSAAVVFDSSGCGASWLPGDVNGDGGIDISDPVADLNFQFAGIPLAAACLLAGDGLNAAGLLVADFNGDGGHDISDPVASLNFQFVGGANPPHALGTSCITLPESECEDSCQ